MWFRALRVTESGTRPKPFGALIFDKRIVNNDGWRSTTRDAQNHLGRDGVEVRHDAPPIQLVVGRWQLVELGDESGRGHCQLSTTNYQLTKNKKGKRR